jgi:hypothetical protein
MSFEARVYIQGVGVYVPHADRPETELLVLFPKQEIAESKGVSTKEKPICRHHAAVQFSARYLEDGHRTEGLGTNREIAVAGPPPDGWATLDVSGLWLWLTAPAAAATRPTRLSIADLETGGHRVPGVPHLPEILRDQVPPGAASPLDPSIHPGAWPNGGTEADFLKGGLYLDQGVLSPYAEFEGLYRFPRPRKNGAKTRALRRGSPNPDDHKLSSVLKLELGQVESFTLHGRSFEGGPVFDLPLKPPADPDGVPWDELEIWVRHFCELDQPDPDGKTAEPGEEDVDFVLNYMVLEHLTEVLAAFGNALPVPQVSSSWARGGLIGSEARKCMGNSALPKSFKKPHG